MWVRGPNLPNYDTTSTTSKATPMMTYIPLTLVSQPSLKVQCSNQLVKSYIIGADQEILVCNLLDEVFNDSARLLLLTKLPRIRLPYVRYGSISNMSSKIRLYFMHCFIILDLSTI